MRNLSLGILRGQFARRMRKTMEKRFFKPLWLLLLLPYIGLLWVPFYNFAQPEFLGFPFFYWYQLAWVPVTSVLIYIVFRSLGDDE